MAEAGGLNTVSRLQTSARATIDIRLLAGPGELLRLNAGATSGLFPRTQPYSWTAI